MKQIFFLQSRLGLGLIAWIIFWAGCEILAGVGGESGPFWEYFFHVLVQFQSATLLQLKSNRLIHFTHVFNQPHFNTRFIDSRSSQIVTPP